MSNENSTKLDSLKELQNRRIEHAVALDALIAREQAKIDALEALTFPVRPLRAVS